MSIPSNLVIRYYEDGKVNYLYEMDDSRNQHGLYCRWFQNGKVAEECTYVNGLEHGPAITYSTDGSTYTTSEYVNGYLYGIIKHYNGRTHQLTRTDIFYNNQIVTYTVLELVKDINNITAEEKTQIALQIGLIL